MQGKEQFKNPAYGRHRIPQPMRIEAPIPINTRSALKERKEKKKKKDEKKSPRADLVKIAELFGTFPPFLGMIL